MKWNLYMLANMIDRKETTYNSGFAMVRDFRKFEDFRYSQV